MTRASAKTQAALEVQAAEARAGGLATVCTDASGARIRTVGVHLTNFAPGCDGMAIDNRKRWATLWGVSPLRAVKATLKRINRSPRAVGVRADEAGVNLLAQPTVVQLGKVQDQAADAAPFAVFWDGLTEPEVRAALADLIRTEWEPPAPRPKHP